MPLERQLSGGGFLEGLRCQSLNPRVKCIYYRARMNLCVKSRDRTTTTTTTTTTEGWPPCRGGWAQCPPHPPFLGRGVPRSESLDCSRSGASKGRLVKARATPGHRVRQHMLWPISSGSRARSEAVGPRCRWSRVAAAGTAGEGSKYVNKIHRDIHDGVHNRTCGVQSRLRRGGIVALVPRRSRRDLSKKS